jgi:3-deoxy-D-manno-octulosonate 8-phosphate phosphatase KdsC-like HAD superfamily phosphatase
MTEYVIFDIDGTLADCNHRLHYVRSKPRNFDAFETAVMADQPIWPIINTLKWYIETGIDVYLLTGRNEKIRPETEKWLADHGIVGYKRLFMKRRKFEQDVVQKSAVLDKLIEKYNKLPLIVYEDRERVVDMWKRRGVFVANVDQTIGD